MEENKTKEEVPAAVNTVFHLEKRVEVLIPLNMLPPRAVVQGEREEFLVKTLWVVGSVTLRLGSLLVLPGDN